VIGRALLGVCALAAVTTASPWKATRGTLEPGALEGTFLLTSDAVPGRYSEAEMITTEAVALPYKLTVTWRRLGSESGRSMHVLVAGGVVLIKSGAIAFYAYDDAAFAQGDWRPIAGYSTLAEHVVRVIQDKQRLTVFADGTEVAHFDFEVARASAHVGVGMKSAPSLRSAIYLRAITVSP